MTKAKVVTSLTLAALALGACGGDEAGEVRTVTVPAAQETATPGPANPEAILIQTRVLDGRQHRGEVAGGSMIGEKAFCRGGKTSGGSDGPTITTRFRCPGGTLEVRYAPTQMSLVQGSVWEVLRGTGAYEGLRGGGSMVAAFEGGDSDAGREIFTGLVGK